eukprot:CAMPEP_0197542720 /NCGR_PEP_ID=MMETSP1318-20131121/67743_1 /TAXON_ID=552666 /ORGANISM="Partenskyella glossopodia, Strain RCC365" /LENGTH=229 /DNA_ID=CAMNT_0043102005 /DNA_START=37 /DNA_END=727 /DNA_ORIENTATION=-
MANNSLSTNNNLNRAHSTPSSASSSSTTYCKDCKGLERQHSQQLTQHLHVKLEQHLKLKRFESDPTRTGRIVDSKEAKKNINAIRSGSGSGCNTNTNPSPNLPSPPLLPLKRQRTNEVIDLGKTNPNQKRPKTSHREGGTSSVNVNANVSVRVRQQLQQQQQQQLYQQQQQQQRYQQQQQQQQKQQLKNQSRVLPIPVGMPAAYPLNPKNDTGSIPVGVMAQAALASAR